MPVRDMEFAAYLGGEYRSATTGGSLQSTSVSDSVSNCGRVERTLGLDLESELRGAANPDALTMKIDEGAARFNIEGDRNRVLASIKTGVRRYFDFLKWEARHIVMTSRLEKAAIDNGFDRELPPHGEWRGFASTQAPLEVWLGAAQGGQLLAALSQAHVAKGLADLGTSVGVAPPPGAAAVLAVADVMSLHRLLRRAFQLSRSLPDVLLIAFQKKTATMPKSTEAERLVVQRVGQGLFRAGLLEFWEGRCAITGLHVPELLRASHIKPWANCENDAERLDVWNGLLLAPHLDAAFDLGFITVADDGAVRVSDTLAAVDRALLGLDAPLRVERLSDGHRQYLPWHWKKIWNGVVPRG